jgi:hypothetical protein
VISAKLAAGNYETLDHADVPPSDRGWFQRALGSIADVIVMRLCAPVVELSAMPPQFESHKPCQKRRRIKLADDAFDVAETPS